MSNQRMGVWYFHPRAFLLYGMDRKVETPWQNSSSTPQPREPREHIASLGSCDKMPVDKQSLQRKNLAATSAYQLFTKLYKKKEGNHQRLTFKPNHPANNRIHGSMLVESSQNSRSVLWIVTTH